MTSVTVLLSNDAVFHQLTQGHHTYSATPYLRPLGFFDFASYTIWNSLPGELIYVACGLTVLDNFLWQSCLASTSASSTLEGF